jgi:acyl-CoA hydrolase
MSAKSPVGQRSTDPTVELWPVDYVNDQRIIATEPNFVSVNSAMTVDLLGQCASETLHGQYYSSSGGQADFARKRRSQ